MVAAVSCMASNQFKLLPVFAIEMDMIGNRFVYVIAANAKHVAKKDIDISNCPPSSVGRAQGP